MKPSPFLIAFLLGCLCVSSCEGGDLEAAVIDRNQFPKETWSNYYYMSLEVIPEERRAACLASLNFVCASTSFVQHVEQILPARVTDTLYRIDVKALGWNTKTVWELLAKTPYRRYEHTGPFLVNNTAWFIVFLSDATESSGYNELLLGKEKPTREDFLKAFKTNEDPSFLFSKIEGNSGVSVAKRRWLLNFPNSIRTDVWGTLDSFKIEAKNDPLGNLDYVIDKRWKQQPVHDGEEWIAGLPKFSSSTNIRGRLQAYFLGSSAGESVAEAPPRLVYDSSAYRGHGAIVNFGGCVGCHSSGLNFPNDDAFKQYSLQATAYSKDKDKAERLNQTLLAPVAGLITKANEEYALGVQMVTGMQPKEFVPAYLETINWYDSPVDLEQAARELYCSQEDLKLAIAYRQSIANDLEAGLAQLAGQGKIPRTLWEDLYLKVSVILKEYKAK